MLLLLYYQRFANNCSPFLLKALINRPYTIDPSVVFINIIYTCIMCRIQTTMKFLPGLSTTPLNEQIAKKIYYVECCYDIEIIDKCNATDPKIIILLIF